MECFVFLAVSILFCVTKWFTHTLDILKRSHELCLGDQSSAEDVRFGAPMARGWGAVRRTPPRRGHLPRSSEFFIWILCILVDYGVLNLKVA
jgi:hypothetical protein